MGFPTAGKKGLIGPPSENQTGKDNERFPWKKGVIALIITIIFVADGGDVVNVVMVVRSFSSSS